MSKEPMEDFGKQIKKSVKYAMKSGDFSRLKDIGPAAEKMMKDIAETVSDAIDSPKKASERTNGFKEESQQPYEPVVNPRPGSKYQNTQGPAWAGANWNGWGSKKKRRNPFGVLPVVLGAVGLGLFAVLFLVSGVLTLASVAAGGLASVVLAAAGLLASSISLGFGASRRALGTRINHYYNLLEQKNVQTIDELAAAAASPVAQVKNDVQKAMRKQLMPGVRVDTTGTTLMLGDEAYNLYLETETNRKQKELDKAERERRLKNPETAELEKFKADGAAAIRSIHAANKAIEDEEMSAKMDRLAITAGKVFAYVQTNPQKIPDTRKMMDYYLPTTLKLLQEYQKYDEMDVQVPSVLKAKKEIADMLDTVDEAFNNLLESLYQHDTLDVKTDIKVLQAMLQQEGLTGEKFELDAEQKPGDPLHL
ncbi:5-bromo-4-chloroindolyl phosphate hydrolysis family protein [Ruminococcaceae bacterium OttesenSCG-928-A16]|nr:5-bromo-4-chloroindolyl phosphate hydrolysis family protein [Ruminococcaceae bacterium OttesenSCG-928-A16]